MKKKIFAALSALTLGATMMGGMAMTASATTVTDSATGANLGDGGFYAYYYGTDNPDDENPTYTLDWHRAPYGMDDANISEAVYNASTGKVTLTLVENVYDNGYSGEITEVYTSSAGTGPLTYTDEDGNIKVDLEVGSSHVYYLEMSPANPHSQYMAVYFAY